MPFVLAGISPSSIAINDVNTYSKGQKISGSLGKKKVYILYINEFVRIVFQNRNLQKIKCKLSWKPVLKKMRSGKKKRLFCWCHGVIFTYSKNQGFLDVFVKMLCFVYSQLNI